MATAAAGILVIVVIIMYLDNIVVHSSQQKAPTVQELETWHDHYVNEETLNIYHSSTRGRCWFSLAASIVHACTIDALFMLIQHLNQTCITLQRMFLLLSSLSMDEARFAICNSDADKWQLQQLAF